MFTLVYDYKCILVLTKFTNAINKLTSRTYGMYLFIIHIQEGEDRSNYANNNHV